MITTMNYSYFYQQGNNNDDDNKNTNGDFEYAGMTTIMKIIILVIVIRI